MAYAVVPIGRDWGPADSRHLRFVLVVFLAVAKVHSASIWPEFADLHAGGGTHYRRTLRLDVSVNHDALVDRVDVRYASPCGAIPRLPGAILMLDPRFSIVTPSFNQRAYIEEALLSVKNQDYPEVEHIIVDAASTDGTVEVLKEYASRPGWRHLRWISEPDGGQSEALNKGFRMISGQIVGWLNSDDRYRAGCFRAVADAFERKPRADVVYGDHTWIDQAGVLLKVRRQIEFNPFILLYHHVVPVPTPSSFFRRQIFDDGNFIDVKYHYAMDYEFFSRLSQKGYWFQHLTHILADFRWQPQSKSSKAAGKQFEERDLIVVEYSRFLRAMPEGRLRKMLLVLLRTQAAFLYGSEKLFRGYYFEEMGRGQKIQGKAVHPSARFKPAK